MVLPGTNPRARRIVPVPRHSLGAPPVTAIISPETQLDTGSASCPACPARNVSGARCGLSALVDAVFVIGLALGLCGTATCAKERPRGRWRRRYGSPLLGYRIFKALPRRLLRCTARRKVDSAPMPAPLGNETAAFRRVRQIRRYPLEGLPFTFDQACSIDGISGVDRMARRHICPARANAVVTAHPGPSVPLGRRKGCPVKTCPPSGRDCRPAACGSYLDGRPGRACSGRTDQSAAGAGQSCRGPVGASVHSKDAQLLISQAFLDARAWGILFMETCEPTQASRTLFQGNAGAMVAEAPLRRRSSAMGRHRKPRGPIIDPEAIRPPAPASVRPNRSLSKQRCGFGPARNVPQRRRRHDPSAAQKKNFVSGQALERLSRCRDHAEPARRSGRVKGHGDHVTAVPILN